MGNGAGDPRPQRDDDASTLPAPIVRTPAPGARQKRVAFWIRALLGLATIRVIAGLIAAAVGPPLWASDPAFPAPPAVNVVQVLVFAAAAGWLILGGGKDRRAVLLGGVFLLIASAFCDRLLQSAVEEGLPGPAAAAFRGLVALPLDSFLAALFWLFARDFPRAARYGAAQRVASFFLGAAVTIGFLFFAVNAAVELSPHDSALRALEPLSRAKLSFMWVAVFALFLPALPYIFWRGRRARLDERRRVALFASGLMLGIGPLFLEVLLENVIPPFGAFMTNRPEMRKLGGFILYPLLLSTPFTTAYSVLVDRVLDVRLVLRKALRYALARSAVIAAAVTPFAVLAAFIYRHRDEPVADLVTGSGALVLGGVALIGLIALWLRQPILDALDRRFFREQYDSRRILTELAQRSRTVGSVEELAATLTSEIDRALHLDAIAVLVLDRATHVFVAPDGVTRELDAASELARQVSDSVQPLEIDLERPDSSSLRLTREDRQWLADGGFKLLLPLIASDGAPLALMALGEKRSELPFSQEDRSLLVAIAASATLALEHRMLVASGPGAVAVATGDPATEADLYASECADCRFLGPPGAASCANCGGALSPAHVPHVLGDKFRFERRIGAGGMGVVYRAVDLVLERPVAIKALPRLSPERAIRMRREARAMAAVSHDNLAMIFGAETWRGTPLLIVEYLEGGTLADVLHRRRLAVHEALDLGIVLSRAVGVIHRAGILHRDIKPSNIGFTGERKPKVLDFGLARILEDAGSGLERPTGYVDVAAIARRAASSATLTASTLTLDVVTGAGVLVGTPPYLSPEAVAGRTPDPSFDLWSLALVLFEGIAGRNPFVGDDLKQTLDRIRHTRLPDLRKLRPECSEAVALFFEAALSRQRKRRPATAGELESRLEDLRSAVQ